MPKAYSQDLRDRVIDAVERGLIPRLIDHDPQAHSRVPMDMILQG